MKSIDELQYIIGFIPENKEMFELALTHSSCNADSKIKNHDYERLEYIGDSVVGFVTADIIYNVHKDMGPGNMTKLRSILVKTDALADYTRKLGLVEFIRHGNSISYEDLMQKNKILEDVFEAFTGAIYLEKGIEFAYQFVKKFVYDAAVNFNEDDLTDSKSKLQEIMQAEGRDLIKYVTIAETGPSHDRTFTVEVLLDGNVLGTGVGKSKKAAEEDAAKKALEKRR